MTNASKRIKKRGIRNDYKSHEYNYRYQNCQCDKCLVKRNLSERIEFAHDRITGLEIENVNQNSQIKKIEDLNLENFNLFQNLNNEISITQSQLNQQAEKLTKVEEKIQPENIIKSTETHKKTEEEIQKKHKQKFSKVLEEIPVAVLKKELENSWVAKFWKEKIAKTNDLKELQELEHDCLYSIMLWTTVIFLATVVSFVSASWYWQFKWWVKLVVWWNKPVAEWMREEEEE